MYERHQEQASVPDCNRLAIYAAQQVNREATRPRNAEQRSCVNSEIADGSNLCAHTNLAPEDGTLRSQRCSLDLEVQDLVGHPPLVRSVFCLAKDAAFVDMVARIGSENMCMQARPRLCSVAGAASSVTGGAPLGDVLETLTQQERHPSGLGGPLLCRWAVQPSDCACRLCGMHIDQMLTDRPLAVCMHVIRSINTRYGRPLGRPPVLSAQRREPPSSPRACQELARADRKQRPCRMLRCKPL